MDMMMGKVLLLALLVAGVALSQGVSVDMPANFLEETEKVLIKEMETAHISDILAAHTSDPLPTNEWKKIPGGLEVKKAVIVDPLGHQHERETKKLLPLDEEPNAAAGDGSFMNKLKEAEMFDEKEQKELFEPVHNIRVEKVVRKAHLA